MNFKGKTAVIAGDAWGLGHAAALMFAREGAHVVCIDDNAETKDARVLRMDESRAPALGRDPQQVLRDVGDRAARAPLPRGVGGGVHDNLTDDPPARVA